MSYARKGLDGSDVYVFATGDGEWWCHECSISGGGLVRCASPADMLAHLQSHVRQGEHVPRAALDRLERESGGGAAP